MHLIQKYSTCPLDLLPNLQGGDHHEAQRLIRDLEQGRCDRPLAVSKPQVLVQGSRVSQEACNRNALILVAFINRRMFDHHS